MVCYISIKSIVCMMVLKFPILYNEMTLIIKQCSNVHHLHAFLLPLHDALHVAVFFCYLAGHQTMSGQHM